METCAEWKKERRLEAREAKEMLRDDIRAKDREANSDGKQRSDCNMSLVACSDVFVEGLRETGEWMHSTPGNFEDVPASLVPH